MQPNHTIVVLALNNHTITETCLNRVRESGYRGKIILIDNGSNPPMFEIARKFSCDIIRNKQNKFVNPMWNFSFKICATRYLTLLNNDCLVKDSYLNEITDIMQNSNSALLTCKAECVKEILSYNGSLSKESQTPIIDFNVKRDGHLMTIDLDIFKKNCRANIPQKLKVWYGDDWIWGELRRKGFKCGSIQNRLYIREENATIRKNPQINPILQRDLNLGTNSRLLTEIRIFAGSAPHDALKPWHQKKHIMYNLVTRFKDYITLGY